MLKQIVMLEDNSELVQDEALKHKESRELRYQSGCVGQEYGDYKCRINNHLYFQDRTQHEPGPGLSGSDKS